MKNIDKQIAEMESCIDRVKLASERLWQLAEGGKKRFLDAEECKVLSQLANAESRAHNELRELRIAKQKQPETPVDEGQLETQAVEFLRARGWTVEPPSA